VRASWAPGPANGAPQSLGNGHRRRPAKQLARARDGDIEAAGVVEEAKRELGIEREQLLVGAHRRDDNDGALAALKAQNGMFSQLPVTAAQTIELRDKHGVYMPASGRINIAGLNPKDIPALSEILGRYL
jgi:aspartate aminotransferase/aromatic-amino-acid transaminase